MTKTVCIQGLGFVGFAMAIAVASAKNINTQKPLYQVIGVDLDNRIGRKKIKEINDGEFPISCNDKELENAYFDVLKAKNFKATTNTNYFKKADYVIVDINLDVAIKGEFSNIDFDNFKNAIKTIGQNIKKDTLVVIETTIPPGTTEKLIYPILVKEFEKRFDKEINPKLAHSYERVMPGPEYLSSIINFWRVYSGIDKESEISCEKFLSTIINTEKYPLQKLSSCNASELSKVLENSYRAINIAFIEEWGIFAENIGVNLFEVLNAIKIRPTHSNIRNPGLGVGGYCLTKDPLMGYVSKNHFFKNFSGEFPITKKAIEINNLMPFRTYEITNNYIKEHNLNKKILILGLSYRDQVGDIRNSASIDLAKYFLKNKYSINSHDPLVKEEISSELGYLKKLPKAELFSGIVLTVSHNFYRELNILNWLKNFKGLFLDANNILSENNIQKIKNKNINLKIIGRGDL